MNKVAVILLIVAQLASGCSVFMAAKQPDKKDLTVFNQGVNRSAIIAEYGHPTATSKTEYGRMDVFRFTQGYTKFNKTSRAVGHGAMDVLTLGLWEIAGTPAEMINDGTEMAVEVQYDASDTVTQVIPLTEKTKLR